MSLVARQHTPFARWASALSVGALIAAGLLAAGGWIVNDSAGQIETQAASMVTARISSQQMLLGYHLKELLHASEAPTIETSIHHRYGGMLVEASADGKTHRVGDTGAFWADKEGANELEQAYKNWNPEASAVDKALNWAWGQPGKRIARAFSQSSRDMAFKYETVFFDDRAETTYSGLSLDICQQRLQVADQMGTPATYGATAKGVPMKLHTPGDFVGVNVCDTVVVVVPK